MTPEELGHYEHTNELNNFHYEQRLSDQYDNPRD